MKAECDDHGMACLSSLYAESDKNQSYGRRNNV